MQIRSLFALALVLSVASCKSAATPQQSVVLPSVGTGALTDANIAAIVFTANNSDILYATLALAKSSDANVRAFAMMTKKDHESVNEALRALVTRLGLTPVEHTVSLDMRDDAAAKRLGLRDLEGFVFDSAYAANEASYHAAVLAAVDEALIPSAQNEEVRALLIAVRPAVAAHLEHARELSAKKTTRP
jgi:putative membrane protein